MIHELSVPALPAEARDEARRHACEVQYVLALPSRERRAAYLEAVREHRGSRCAEALADAVRALWATRRDQGRAQLQLLINRTATPAPRAEDGDNGSSTQTPNPTGDTHET